MEELIQMTRHWLKIKAFFQLLSSSFVYRFSGLFFKEIDKAKGHNRFVITLISNKTVIKSYLKFSKLQKVTF